MSTSKVTVEVKLPQHVAEYVRTVARTAGVKPETVILVMTAVQVLRWQAPEQQDGTQP